MKKLKYLLCLLTISFALTLNVNAASGKISLSASSTSIEVGDTTTVTVTCSSTSAIGSCDYTLSYDKTKLKITSGSATGALWNEKASKSVKSLTNRVTFKAIAEGTSSISVKVAQVYDFNDSPISTTTGKVSIKGYIPSKEPTTNNNSSSNNTTTPVTYSTNNNLKTLTISSGTLSPKFSKNTTKYTVSLDSSIEKLTVKATTEDSKAKVTGNKTYTLGLGTNKINVVVTSEKGTKKTYTITVTVEDKNPIDVLINNENYTVVKQKSLLEKPNNYKDKKITIEEQEIPAFYNELTSYTLIGLKDTEGNIKLYIYNENENTYNLYQELQFNNIKFSPINTDEKLKGYQKANVTIGESKVNGYKLNRTSNYTIIYGMNLETGEKGWYQYEKTENTIQKFSNELMDTLLDNNKESEEIIKILGSVIIILALLIIIVSSKKSKKKKKKNKQEKVEKEIVKKTENNESKKKEKKKKATKILDEW